MRCTRSVHFPVLPTVRAQITVACYHAAGLSADLLRAGRAKSPQIVVFEVCVQAFASPLRATPPWLLAQTSSKEDRIATTGQQLFVRRQRYAR